jgi:hypothetical protein
MSPMIARSNRYNTSFPGRPMAIVTGLLFLAVTGCLDPGLLAHEEETDETRSLPVVGTHRVAVKTDNGYVQVRPAAEGVDTIEVHAFIRAKGHDAADARECLESIEIATPVSGKDDATQEISWAWRQPREPHWQATVSFEIAMPNALPLDVTTSNGKIDIVGITGDCRAKTNNGAVRMVAAADSIAAETDNGEIRIESPARTVRVSTSNGAVRATLTNPDEVGGKIKSNNGAVRVVLAKTANLDLKCSANHGNIRNKLPLTDTDKGRNRLSGKLAAGGETLEIRTNNGGITLEPYAPGRNNHSDD